MFGFHCPLRFASGGCSLKRVGARTTLGQLRVLASAPDTDENSCRVHISNSGPPSRGAAPLVIVQMVALC
jgi:hypothetical protein